MIKLNIPKLSQEEIYKDCTNNIRKGTRLTYLLNSKTVIVEKSKEYDLLALQGELYTIREHDDVCGMAKKEDMVWLYDNKFVKDGGRKYYNQLLLIPPYGICPLCGQRRVSTLDHYLPKTLYPTYAITSYNLVPSCYECNKAKATVSADTRVNETIHPYYDDFDDEVWVKAEVIESRQVGFNYYTYKPNNWSSEKYNRAKKHFDTYKLDKLYSSHAAEEYCEYLYSIKKLFAIGREKLVKSDLAERVAASRSNRLNTWKAAMYSALLESEWYFNQLDDK